MPINTKRNQHTDKNMPSTTRKKKRSSLAVQATAMSIQGGGSVASNTTTTTNAANTAIVSSPCEFYNSDKDYDSDADAQLSMAERVSSKLRSVLHNSWVDLEDENECYPHDMDHNLATVEPKMEELAEFLVDVEESLVWWKESAEGRKRFNDIEAWCNMFREVKKDDRFIGTRLLLELKMVIDTWVTLYRGLEKNRPALEASLLVRPVRTSSDQPRTEPTETTTGEALVRRMEVLKYKVDDALVKCGEHV